MPELPHGTVTLLFSDVEGSTRLARLLGVRYDEALAAHRRLLREAIAANGGSEVDTQGDAFLVAFDRARDALRTAAAAVQRALAEHEWSQGEPVLVRIGVHSRRAGADGWWVLRRCRPHAWRPHLRRRTRWAGRPLPGDEGSRR